MISRNYDHGRSTIQLDWEHATFYFFFYLPLVTSIHFSDIPSYRSTRTAGAYFACHGPLPRINHPEWVILYTYQKEVVTGSGGKARST